MAKMTDLYVSQDGGDFYLYPDSDREKLIRTEHAPFPVRDGDFEAAIKAREWFMEWGYFKGAQRLHWL